MSTDFNRANEVEECLFDYTKSSSINLANIPCFLKGGFEIPMV
jgi:hypothetical protein